MRTARIGLILSLAALACSCGGPAETEVPFRFDDRVVIEATVNGVVGAPVLSRFNLILDYAGRRLLLTPRSEGGDGSRGGRDT
jgi:hypothetical protein